MDLAELTAEMHRFVKDQGWYDDDSPKTQSQRNLAVSLSVEAAEVLEFFQWTEEPPDKGALAGELADVMLYLIQLASLSGIDLEQAVLDKLRDNYDRSW
jgi:NTP pyrophosphatase (non-canonical NTP hydrolase)